MTVDDELRTKFRERYLAERWLPPLPPDATTKQRRKWRISPKRRNRLKRYLASRQGGEWERIGHDLIMVCPCKYCGLVQPAKRMTFDHVIPRSKDGTHHWTNLVLACRRCNVRKGANLPEGMP